MSWTDQDADPFRATMPGLQAHVIRFVGGSGAVTKVTGTGPGVTVSYVGSGVVNLVWDKPPGTFVGFLSGIQAATPNDVDTYKCVADTYDTTTFTLPITLSEAGTPTDLAANEWATCVVLFYRPGMM